MTTKLCKHCNTVKPIEELTKDNRSKDGHTSTCKKCVSEKAKATYDPQKAKEHRLRNIESIKERQKKYYHNNKDIFKQKNKEYQQKKGKEIYLKAKERQLEWAKNNPEKMAEYIRKHRQTEKYKIQKRNSKLKRRQKERDGTATANDIRTLYSNATICYWCNIKFTKEIIKTIDHYVPLKLGGRHDLDNLVVSCKKCNSKKREQKPEDFAQSIGKLF